MRKVAVLSLADPMESTTGGTLRTRAIVGSLEANNLSVDVLFPGAGSTVDRSLGERRLASNLGILKRRYLPMPTVTGGKNRALQERIVRGNYDAIVVSALSQVPLAEAAEKPLWLDFMDVWSDFCEREVSARRGLPRLTAKLQRDSLRRSESRFSGSSTVITAAGWEDHISLNRRMISAVWLPTAVASSRAERQDVVSPVSTTVGFLGNFNYWPNVDAYHALVEYWLPGIQSAGWECVVAGIGSEELPRFDGLRILGELTDVAQFYDNVDVVVAPIRLGGGIKVKIIESLMRGIPVIGTEFSVQGFPSNVREFVATKELVDPSPFSVTDIRSVRVDASALLPFTQAGFNKIVTNDVVPLWLGGAHCDM